jgi:hypothetical protein
MDTEGATAAVMQVETGRMHWLPNTRYPYRVETGLNKHLRHTTYAGVSGQSHTLTMLILPISHV